MCMLASAVGLLADRSFLGVFCAAMLTIGIGWGLRKKNVLKAESRTVLNTLLLKLTVPCLAFDAFMADFDRGELRRNLQILLLSFVLYLTMIALAQLIFARYGKQKANLYGLCFAIGQQTLYAMPILRAIYQSDPAEAMLSASMVAIAFRVMLYLYAFYSISGAAVTGGSLRQSLKKAFLTPVMLAMFAGFLIWLSQELLPAPGGIPLLRLDLRLPAHVCGGATDGFAGEPPGDAADRFDAGGRTAGRCAAGRQGVVYCFFANVYCAAVHIGIAVPVPAGGVDPLYRGDADDGGDVLCRTAFCCAVYLFYHLPQGGGYRRTGMPAFDAVLCCFNAAMLLPGEGGNGKRGVPCVRTGATAGC